MDLYQRLKQIYDSVPGKFKEHSSVDSAIAWWLSFVDAEGIGDMSQKEVAEMFFDGLIPYKERTSDEMIKELISYYTDENDIVERFIDFYINDKTESDEEEDEL